MQITLRHTHTHAHHLFLAHACGAPCPYLLSVPQVALARYKRWSAPPRSRPTLSKRPRQELLDEKLLPDFKNGRKLRDYQVGGGGFNTAQIKQPTHTCCHLGCCCPQPLAVL